MKNLRTFTFLFLFASLFSFTACESEDCSDGEQNQNETGVDCGGVCDACPLQNSLTANLDGSPYDGSPITGANLFGIVQVIGDMNQNEQISLILPASAQVGTYDHTDPSYTISFVLTNSATIYFPKSGSIDITSNNTIDSEIEGTFEATMYNIDDDSDTVVISNGAFGYNY